MCKHNFDSAPDGEAFMNGRQGEGVERTSRPGLAGSARRVAIDNCLNPVKHQIFATMSSSRSVVEAVI